jgi:hypothetical protein
LSTAPSPVIHAIIIIPSKAPTLVQFRLCLVENPWIRNR